MQKEKQTERTGTLLHEFCAGLVEGYAAGDVEILGMGQHATVTYYIVKRIVSAATVFGKVRFGLMEDGGCIYVHEITADMQISEKGSITYVPRRVFKCKHKLARRWLCRICKRKSFMVQMFCITTYTAYRGYSVDITLETPKVIRVPTKYDGYNSVTCMEIAGILDSAIEKSAECFQEYRGDINVHAWELDHATLVCAEQYAAHMLTLNATLHAQAAIAVAEKMARATVYAAEIRADATVRAAEIRADGQREAAFILGHELNCGAQSRQHELMGGIYRA